MMQLAFEWYEKDFKLFRYWDTNPGPNDGAKNIYQPIANHCSL